MHWTSKKGDFSYSAKIDGIKIELTEDKGTPQSYGARTLLARHFLEREKWHRQVKENFGEKVFDEIYSYLKNNYEKYKEEKA